MDSPNKKQHTWRSSVRMHSDLLLQFIPNLVALLQLNASEIDAIGNAVNDVNDCNLSAVRHEAMSKFLLIESTGRQMALFKVYGKEYARYDSGDATATRDLFEEISTTKSSSAAMATQAVAFFETWENLLGNTIMASLNGLMNGGTREEQSFIFLVVNFLYFFPIYVVLAIYYTVLSVVPKFLNTPILYKVNYFIISLIDVCAMLPVSLLCLLLRTVVETSPPLGSRTEYIPIVNDIPKNSMVEIVKPSQEMKVGIRFGCGQNGNLLISNVKHGSLASTAGLRIGDQVKSINGRDVQKLSPKFAANIMLEAIGVVRLGISQSNQLAEYDERTV
jgi:hypothetical protein